MGFPRKLLTPGEEVVVEAHPNWSVLIRPVFTSAVLLAACVAVLVLWSSAPLWTLYVFAAVAAVVGVYLAASVASWRARLLVVTTTRVVYRWGVLHRTGREIPLGRIQDVTYHQSIVERMLGAGSLLIESAGASGQEPFPDIRHPAAMQSLINQLIATAGDRAPMPARRSAPPPPPAPSPAPSNALGEELRDLERLHDLGVITDDEFDAKRKALLGFSS